MGDFMSIHELASDLAEDGFYEQAMLLLKALKVARI